MLWCSAYTYVHQIQNSLLLHIAESALKVTLPGLVGWVKVMKGTCHKSPTARAQPPESVCLSLLSVAVMDT